MQRLNEQEADSLTEGQQRAAISNAMTRIKHEFYGKGPTRAKTYIFDNYVFCVLEDVLTTAEETLKDAGDSALVREMRLAFQDLMSQSFVAEVEKLTGRRVVGYHSQVVFDPDMALEMFVLDDGGPSGLDDGGVSSAGHDEPGSVGDVDALPSGEDSPTTASGLREVDATRASDRRVEGRGNSRETAISNAMVRLTHELYGKGAKRAKSYLTDDMLFCALEEPLTVVERTLVEGGLSGMVRQIRIRFQDLTEDRFTGEVAQATGCTVLNCHTQIVFDPDVLFLIFVLEADAKATRGSDVLKPGVSG